MSTLTPARPHTHNDVPSVTHAFRCVVYMQKSTGMYVAECIDLNLIVKDKKANRAIRELGQAIAGHVRVAHQVGELSLLNRPSPLSHRLRYQFAKLTQSIAKSLSGDARFFTCDQSGQQACLC